MKNVKRDNLPKREWERSQITLRLTNARKMQLIRIAAREGVGGGPGKAIDRAIDLALVERSETDAPSEVLELSEKLSSCSDAAERRMAIVERRLEELLTAVETLTRTIASVASEEF